MLAYLAHVENPAPRSRLAARFWSESPDLRAKQSLRQALSELRNAVGEALEVSPDTVALKRDRLAIDSQLFLRDVQDGQWSQALARWQGDFLPGLEDVGDQAWRDWLTGERAVYTREYQRAREASGEISTIAAPAVPSGGRQKSRSGGTARDFSLGLLGTLSTDARAVVEAAAVIGSRAPAPLLRQVTSLSQAGFSSAMAELASRGMLMESDETPGCYDFATASTRLRVYNVTAAYRRQALHALVSQALEDGIAARSAPAGSAAEHARLSLPEPAPARGRMVALVIGLLGLVALAAAWYFLS